MSYVILIFIMSCCLCFPLIDPSEARFALIAKLSLERETYLIPVFYDNSNNLTNYYSKPPLYIWLVMIFQTIFPLELASRMPSILSGFLYIRLWRTLLTKFKLDNPGESNLIAQYPSLIVLTFLGIIDPLFSLLIFISLVLLFVYRSDFFCGICVGLAILAKGPVAFVLILGPVLIRHWTNSEFSLPKIMTTVAKIVLGISISSGWWFFLAGCRDENFLRYYLLEENIKRYLGQAELKYGTLHIEPIGFAILASLLFLIPNFFRLKAYNFLKSTKLSPFELFQKQVFYSILWIVMFFSLSSTFIVSYLLPLAFLIPVAGYPPYFFPPNIFLNFLGLIAFQLTQFILFSTYESYRFFIPSICGLMLMFLSNRLNLFFIFLTFCGLGFVISSRSNLDLKEALTLTCNIIKTAHTRYHSAELYLPHQITRTFQGDKLLPGECALIASDKINSSSWEVLFRGQNLSVVRANEEIVLE
ncbi:MAG: hypothetical protein NZO16_00825 [Deltaproteobacteria bacterium]|nr:hypothetical protein [Deltaproteobacteria bacterium]